MKLLLFPSLRAS